MACKGQATSELPEWLSAFVSATQSQLEASRDQAERPNGTPWLFSRSLTSKKNPIGTLPPLCSSSLHRRRTLPPLLGHPAPPPSRPLSAPAPAKLMSNLSLSLGILGMACNVDGLFRAARWPTSERRSSAGSLPDLSLVGDARISWQHHLDEYYLERAAGRNRGALPPPAERHLASVLALVNAASRSRPPQPSGPQQHKGHAQEDNSCSQCRYCGGRSHKARTDCPAYGTACQSCGKQHHFAEVCEARGRKLQGQSSSSRQYVQCVHSISARACPRVNVTITTCTSPHSRILGEFLATPDTGADVTIMGRVQFNLLGITSDQLEAQNTST